MEWQILFSGKNKKIFQYHNNPKYWERQALAISVDPDKTSQNAASDEGLHCLPLIQQYF